MKHLVKFLADSRDLIKSSSYTNNNYDDATEAMVLPSGGRYCGSYEGGETQLVLC